METQFRILCSLVGIYVNMYYVGMYVTAARGPLILLRICVKLLTATEPRMPGHSKTAAQLGQNLTHRPL